MDALNGFAAIAALDLDPIKVKLMHGESGEGWTLDRASAIELEYRRFLYLMKMFPNDQAAPLFDVDIFWHYHILDTLKYEVDCQAVFGYFLHHFPYIGLRGEADLAAHQRGGERMRELYEQTFGDSYVRTAWDGKAPVKAAFPASTGKVAFSAATSETAFSAATSRTAFSAATVNTAFPAATAQTAFSAATSKVAFSAATAQTAFSAATAPAASAGAVRQVPAGFFTERPRLAGAS